MFFLLGTYSEYIARFHSVISTLIVKEDANNFRVQFDHSVAAIFPFYDVVVFIDHDVFVSNFKCVRADLQLLVCVMLRTPKANRAHQRLHPPQSPDKCIAKLHPCTHPS